MRCEELNHIPWEELIEPPLLLPLLWCFKPKQLETSCGWRCAEWPGWSSGRGKAIPPTSSKGSVPPPALACPKSWLPGNAYLHKYQPSCKRRDLHRWAVFYRVKYEVWHNTRAWGEAVVCWCGDTLEAKLENLIPSCPRSRRRCGEAWLALLGMSRENGPGASTSCSSRTQTCQAGKGPPGRWVCWAWALPQLTAGLARLSTAQPGLSLLKLRGGEERWAGLGTVLSETILAC